MGKNAAPSTDPYLGWRNATDEDDSLGDKDDDETTMKAGPRSGDKRPGSSQGGRQAEEGEHKGGVRV